MLNALMVSQFGDLDGYHIYYPMLERFVSIPQYINSAFGWSYNSLFYAYGILWGFVALLLLMVVVGLARVNFTRR